MPMYPGGNSKLSAFLSTNLKYPVIAKENRITGRVIIKFIVTETGEIKMLW